MIRCAIELHKDLNSYPSSTPRRHNFGTYRTYHQQQQQQQQISLAISSTKLSELKDLLANEEHFGAKAPVRRQRLFYLGRELKSGGRSLCNLGLGKFNNRILHLCIRPAAKGDEAKDAITKNSKDDDNNNNNSDADADANALEEEGSTVIGGRKRNRAGESALSTSTQQYTTSRQRYINSNITAMNDIDDDDDDRIDAGNNNDNEYGSSSTSRSVVTSTTSIYSRMANNTNLAIDLVDSSSDDDDEVDDNDDDDVEIIEIN